MVTFMMEIFSSKIRWFSGKWIALICLYVTESLAYEKVRLNIIQEFNSYLKENTSLKEQLFNAV
jgi:hypothetical protein